jgi:hypothetical protein
MSAWPKFYLNNCLASDSAAVFHRMLKFIGKTIQVGVADCWARVASDDAEMSPNNVRNSRRLIAALEG